jgi:hypothetical protein
LIGINKPTEIAGDEIQLKVQTDSVGKIQCPFSTSYYTFTKNGLTAFSNLTVPCSSTAKVWLTEIDDITGNDETDKMAINCTQFGLNQIDFEFDSGTIYSL